MRNTLQVAIAAALSFAITAMGMPAAAQDTASNPSFGLAVDGEVRPIVRFTYEPVTNTAGTLTIQVCNTPTCEVVVEPIGTTDQAVMVTVDGSAPIQINGPMVILSTGPMLNESHQLSVSGGQIGVRVDGR